jgi:hypothetical protein
MTPKHPNHKKTPARRIINLLAGRKYREKNREKERLRCLLYSRTKRKKKVRDPIKEKCRATTRNAVAAGKFSKPSTCDDCGTNRIIHAHHNDYSKPFEVDWLCSICHGKRHRAALAAVNNGQP